MNFRKIHRYILLTTLLVFSILLVSGCSNRDSSSEKGTRVVTDCVGRQVEIPDATKKIACIDPFSGEIMVMTGAGDQMICCPNGVKSDSLLQQMYPELEQVPVVQSSGTINAEALLELDPDVILLKNGFYLASDERDKIEKTNIPYLVVKYSNMEEQIRAIRMIRDIIADPASDKAETIAKYYEDTIKLVKKKASKIPDDEKKTVYHSINSATRTDGDSSLGADWIRAVGCENISVGKNLLKEGDVFTTGVEQIFVWDPDIIVCNDAYTTDSFKTKDTFSGLRAVRDGQVFTIPVGATRWGQQGSVETYFAMLWLGKTVYPEQYKDVDLKEEVFAFYSDILQIELTDEQYDKIIEGRGIRGACSNPQQQ